MDEKLLLSASVSCRKITIKIDARQQPFFSFIFRLFFFLSSSISQQRGWEGRKMEIAIVMSANGKQKEKEKKRKSFRFHCLVLSWKVHIEDNNSNRFLIALHAHQSIS